MSLIQHYFENIFLIASAMSLYILFGLLIAGLLKQVIPEDFVSRQIGENSLLSVVKATLFGIPLPVCSCSVIPLAKGLQEEGASAGAVQSFLISTPITGVDSIATTYSFFGWFFTLYRLFTSIIIAITVGIVENLFQKTKKDRVKTMFTTKKETNSCNSGCCETTTTKERFSVTNIISYAFNTLFADIAKSLLWGLLIGAAFSTFLPQELLASIYENQLLTYLMVLIIAMPLYVCATASLPIAASFMLGGMSSGAAFIFLSAGPATNAITMGVVKSMFGRNSLIIYIGVISIMSIFFGYILDDFFETIEIVNIVNNIEELSYLDITSTVIMFALIFYYIFWRK
jgi:uncharacterized membrane protein YraQ (UPF0718 family)